MYKKAIVMLIAICVLASSANVASASMQKEEGTIVSLQYAKTAVAKGKLTISSKGNAMLEGRIYGGLRTKKIVFNMYFQKYSASKKKWTNVKKWSVTNDSNEVKLEKTYKLTSKGKYRVKVKGSAQTSSRSESVSAVSTVKVY